MIRIEIESREIRERRGRTRNDREYHIREQQALLFKSGSKYPDKIRINLDSDQAPYAPGIYQLADDSFYPSRFGNLEVRPVLIAVQAEK